MVINNGTLKYSVIFIILIMMKHSINIERDGYGNPVEVIVGDKIIIVLGFLYMIFTFIILYVV